MEEGHQKGHSLESPAVRPCGHGLDAVQCGLHAAQDHASDILPPVPSACPRVGVFICSFWGLQKREGLLHSSHVTEELTTTTE